MRFGDRSTRTGLLLVLLGLVVFALDHQCKDRDRFGTLSLGVSAETGDYGVLWIGKDGALMAHCLTDEEAKTVAARIAEYAAGMTVEVFGRVNNMASASGSPLAVGKDGIALVRCVEK